MNHRVRFRPTLLVLFALARAPMWAAEPDDFRATLEAARVERDPVRHSLEFGSGLRQWADQDLEAALAYVRRLPPGPDYTQGLLLLLDAIARGDPDRALGLARELASTREQRAFYSSLFAQLARQGLSAALRRLAAVPPGEGRENAVRAVADAWAPADFPAAWAWAQGLPVAEGRSAAIESALAALLPEDPQRLIQLARQFLTGPPLERTVATALQQLIPADPKAAAAIVRTLPAGETRLLAALQISRAWAANAPAGAVAWSEAFDDEHTRQLVLNNAIEVWAAGDVMAAGEYVARMPTGPTQDAVSLHFARFLGGRAPQDAIAWTQMLENPVARDAARTAIVSAWAQHEPAAATRWSATLPAGPAQVEAAAGAFSYWMLQDPRAAQAWLATADLSAELRVRLKPPEGRN